MVEPVTWLYLLTSYPRQRSSGSGLNLGTDRGLGVTLVLGIQSISQLEARYGKANAQTILANCATRIALSGLDVETAEYVSRSSAEGPS